MIRLTTKQKQAWLDLIKANEQASDINMQQWVCGTYGCLWGNYLLYLNKDFQDYTCDFQTISETLGISIKMAILIFGTFYPKKTPYGIPFVQKKIQWAQAKNKSKEECLRTIHKIAYYLLRKSEFVFDEEGVRDEARFSEGDKIFHRLFWRRDLLKLTHSLRSKITVYNET